MVGTLHIKERPTIAFLHECFRYEEGKLFWKERPQRHFRNLRAYNTFNAQYVNKEAGSLRIDGFGRQFWAVWITSFGQILRSHIVYAMHHSVWLSQVDHKNVDSLDDHTDNLRPATRTQNQRNTKCRNKSGFKGVYASGTRWQAKIKIDTGALHLGTFDTPEEAHAAYCKAAQKHFGEFFNAG